MGECLYPSLPAGDRAVPGAPGKVNNRPPAGSPGTYKQKQSGKPWTWETNTSSQPHASPRLLEPWGAEGLGEAINCPGLPGQTAGKQEGPATSSLCYLLEGHKAYKLKPSGQPHTSWACHRASPREPLLSRAGNGDQTHPCGAAAWGGGC